MYYHEISREQVAATRKLLYVLRKVRATGTLHITVVSSHFLSSNPGDIFKLDESAFTIIKDEYSPDMYSMNQEEMLEKIFGRLDFDI